jgi:glycosyltransferase involved in cell wall biosynthesis
MHSSLVRHVAVIGNYLPRQCGIATFTTHLCESLAGEYPNLNLFAVAVNDQSEGYDYPERVRLELSEQDLTSYRRAAEFLKLNNVDLVCLQHEYGIYGGQYGTYILDLLRELHMPVVTTLHTILRTPFPEQRQILRSLAELSDQLIVMTDRGRMFLQEVYGISPRKIQVISHGVPDVPFIDPNFHKDKYAAEGKTVLLTSGLLSANKGIEYVISALPKIRERYPNVVYVVLGTTHPNVKRTEGEVYRDRLRALVQELDLEEHVYFSDAFVPQEQLVESIEAADIYITPYLNEEQIVSGALAYAVGAGKAIISTPYWHAQEVLADNRGIMVPFRDTDAIAEQVCNILDNDVERHAMRKRAYSHGRSMIWSQSARRYMEIFQRVRAERFIFPRAISELPQPQEIPPSVTLDHVRRLTDDIGIMQHGIYSIPNYTEGYTIDDNARALIAAILAERLNLPGCDDSHSLAVRYLAFLWHAYNPDNGYFRNFMGFDRRWLEERGSPDSHARALWAVGTVLRYSQDPGFQRTANLLFGRALPAVRNFSFPRSWAFALLGINEYLYCFPGDRAAQNLRKDLAGRLLDLYKVHHTDEWCWFEPELTYDNATLSRALLISGRAMDREDMVDVAIQTLEWLVRIQQPDGKHFVPIGSNGFYSREELRARFDQQPLEAFATVATCLDAYLITGEDRWEQAAKTAHGWFYGQNDLRIPLFDSMTGGCHDGLQLDRVNQNEGAESTLALVLSNLAFCLIQEQEPLGVLLDVKART